VPADEVVGAAQEAAARARKMLADLDMQPRIMRA